MTQEEEMKALWDSMVSHPGETEEMVSMTPEQMVERGLASNVEAATWKQAMGRMALIEAGRGKDA